MADSSEGREVSRSPTTVNKLDEAIEREVRPWLDLVDSLRAQGIQDELSLPQIAVMGDQSCGKSSVLEALSGVQFPRGSGLVTRCPVQLIMKRTKPGDGWHGKTSVEWKRGPQPPAAGHVASPEALVGVIEELMNAVCEGQKNGFSSDFIAIEIKSPDCPDLTLIDLPGIVRTAVSGQSQGVITEVNGLIENYLRSERTIILAIVPANQDVATVDILERAKKVDPSGKRTIGVLTKPDLINPGGEAEVLEVLSNNRKPLKLGYVMVKNRNQLQLREGVSLKEAHDAEMDFFKSHAVFKTVDSTCLGVESLTKRLVSLLTVRIKDALPNMKWELQESLSEVERDLIPLAQHAPQKFGDKLKTLVQLIGVFCRLLRSSIKGEYRDPALNTHPELRVRSVADRAFRDLQSGVASLNPGFEHPDFPKVLQDQLKAHRGRELCGIVNSQFFFIFMLQQVEKFRPVVETCRNLCCNSLLNIAVSLVSQVAPQYPRLQEAFQGIIESTVPNMAEELQPELDQLFDKEKNPFTENQDLVEAINQVRFERFDRVLHQVLVEAGDGPPNGGDASDVTPLKEWVTYNLGQWFRFAHGANPTSKVEDMSTILQAYWRVTSKRVVDNACMLLETSFFGQVVDRLETQLLALTQEITQEEGQDKAEAKAAAGQEGIGWQQPRLGIFNEDAVLVEKRSFLLMRQQRLKAALGKIENFAPDVLAVSKRLHENERMPAARGGRSGTGPSRTEDTPPQGGDHVRSFKMDPQVFAGSKPERRATEARDGSLAHFVYTKDGDNGGLIYWLGTRRHTRKKFENPHDAGLVFVTSSGFKDGSPSTLVSRRRVPCSTTDEDGSWYCIDVGQNQKMQVSHYSLCHGSATGECDLVNWVCEGYDSTIKMWVIVTQDVRNSPPFLKSPYGVGTWKVDTMEKAFRFIRLRSTGINGRLGNAMALCAIELYGKLYADEA
ncbi:unnamed protein product [Ectocarpus sp. CCAP 1310/34]|nr:unnamed protein product [Ectocarpus sp. CCAP 1310/34]